MIREISNYYYLVATTVPLITGLVYLHRKGLLRQKSSDAQHFETTHILNRIEGQIGNVDDRTSKMESELNDKLNRVESDMKAFMTISSANHKELNDEVIKQGVNLKVAHNRIDKLENRMDNIK